MFEHGSAPLLRYRDSRLTTLTGAGGDAPEAATYLRGGCKIYVSIAYLAYVDTAMLSHACDGPHGPVQWWC